MAVTIGLDETTGDFDLSTGGFNLLSGPPATRQNIIQAQKTVRGTWGGNVVTVGFPISAVLTAGMLLESNGDSNSLNSLAPIFRDFLRSIDGTTGVTGVVKVLTNPEISVDETTHVLHYSVSVLDETSQPLDVSGGIELNGESNI